MARKKTVEYEPSKYQKAIFDFVESGQGNAVIEAQAGSGKTHSAMKCIELIPEGKKVLLTAFNNSIVEELSKKAKKTQHKCEIDCRTIHSLGLKLLYSNYGDKIEKKTNEFKYSSYIYNNIKELGGDCYASLQRKEQIKYIDNVRH